MLFLYRFLTFLVLRFLAPIKKGDIPQEEVDLWIHVSSLGEVLASKPLIEFFLERKLRILLTCFTKTGLQKARELWKDRLITLRFPWDSPYHIQLLLKRSKPKVFIVLETELWPNTLTLVGKMNIPAFLINARISEKNFKRSKKMRWFYKPILRNFTRIYAQSQEDKERFKALGACEELITVTGNIKIDSVFEHGMVYKREDLGLDEKDFVILFASLREKEEEGALSLIEKLAENGELKFIVAPRHLNRVPYIYKGFEERRIPASLWTKEHYLEKVLIIDTLGELRKFYSLSDLVVLGGTFANYGGHNILEIAMAGKVAVVGTFFQNIKGDVEWLSNSGVIELVSSFEDIPELVKFYLENRGLLAEKGQRAREVLKEKQGLSKRIAEEILSYIQKSGGN